MKIKLLVQRADGTDGGQAEAHDSDEVKKEAETFKKIVEEQALIRAKDEGILKDERLSNEHDIYYQKPQEFANIVWAAAKSGPRGEQLRAALPVIAVKAAAVANDSKHTFNV